MSTLTKARPLPIPTPTKPKSKEKRVSASSDTRVGSKSSTSSHNPAKPVTVSSTDESFLKIRPSSIKNKIKRQQIHQQQKHLKNKAKSKEKAKRKKEAGALGEEVDPEEAEKRRKRQKTLENTREADETLVDEADEEVLMDEKTDEFAEYFHGEVRPKIIITTGYKPSKQAYGFIRDLLHVFPNSFYYERKKFQIKTIVRVAKDKGFTDVWILHEDNKKFNSLTHIHLPDGPTAFYKLSSVVPCKDIKDHGNPTEHRPEVILNNFNTRLGHRVGRMLGSMFHQEPEFRGRRVATFHNQRDFIFFRHHRYVFDSKDKARLQELGPRFTLKLQWLQHGTFDTQHGEYEWMHKSEMDTSRRRFFL